jgi:tetratricopeptide (TPR) repeat protein
MPLEGLLDLIRKQFSPTEGQTLVSSLQQDPLVWQFVRENEKVLSYFQIAGSDLTAFSPWKISNWLVKETFGETDADFKTIEDNSPHELVKRVHQAYETVLNTGLPPADLMTGGLLALALQEKRKQSDNWLDVFSEIFEKSRQKEVHKLFQIWRTPFACLFTLSVDFNDLAVDLIQSKNSLISKTSIPLIIHAFLANPLGAEERINRLFNLLVNRNIDLQLDSLKWLDYFQKHALRQTLAKNLLETKKNIDFFASVFSELESFRTQIQNADPLEKQIRYRLPEDLNRLGAFYYYSGNKEKSAEMYQDSSDLLKFLESQTLFQAMRTQKEQTSPGGWLGLMNALPGSRTIKQYYIQALINQEKFDEAEDRLDVLPDSFEKQLLEIQIDQKKNPDQGSSSKSVKTIRQQETPDVPTFPDYYVHNAKFDDFHILLENLKSQKDAQIGLKLADKILQNNYHKLDTVLTIRDVYEKAQNYDKALELTSYLERLEPTNNNHKRKLACLYSKTNRWDETYTTLQEFINQTTNPEIEDLERFAESALKTDRVDTAITVCQNILKKEKYNAKALILLGEGFMYKGDIIKAIQHMEQVVEMIPEEPETWLTLSRLWEENGQKDRAFEILNKGVEKLPEEPELLRSLGKAHLVQHSPSEALSLLQKAYEIAPDDLGGKLDLAEAYSQTGQLDAAWKILESYKDNYKQYPDVAKLMGQVMLAMDEKSSAEPVLFFAADQFPEDIETVTALAKLVIDNFEISFEALSDEKLVNLSNILKKSLEIHPNNLMIKLHSADIERLKGNYQVALDEYKNLSDGEIEENSQENWRIKYGLGKTAIALGENDMGLAALHDAGSMQPENILILQALAEAYHSIDLQTKAEGFAKTALKLAPHEFSNILWYANFKNNNNEPEEAIRAIKEALQINPDQPELKLWLSRLYVSVGSLEESKTILSNLITDENTDPQGLHQAAYTCIRMNELTLSISALEKAFQKTDTFTPILLMDLAAAYVLIDQDKKALETLNVDQDIIQTYPQISMIKSDILCNLGQYQTAYNTLSVIEQIAEDKLNTNQDLVKQIIASPLLYTYDLTFTGYLLRMGQLNQALDHFEFATSYLTKAYDLNHDDEKIQCAIHEAHLQSFNFKEVEKIFAASQSGLDSTTTLSIDSLDIACSQGELLITNGQPEKAESIFDILSTANRSYPRYLAVQSMLAGSHNDLEAADDYFKEAVNAYQNTLDNLNSSNLQIVFRKLRNLVSIALAAKMRNDYLNAIDAFKKAHVLLDNQPLTNWQFAEVLIKAAELQQIARTVSIVKHAPGELVLSDQNQNLSKVLLEKVMGFLSEDEFICSQARMSAAFSGEWPSTLHTDVCLNTAENAASVLISTQNHKLAKEILEAFPNDPDILQSYGLFALKNNKRDGIKAVTKALESDTSNPVNHALLAMLNKNQPDQAIKSIETALEFWPEETDWHAFAADLYNQLGNTELASKHISEAIKSQPENADYWQKSAEIKLRINDLDHARHDLEQSAALNSTNSSLWLKMSDINRRLGNINEATRNIHTAVQLHPENNQIAIKEAQFLFETKQYQQAEDKAEQILKNEENHLDASILLAQALAKQGKFDQALGTLEIAIQKNPQNPNLFLETLKIRKEQQGVETVLPDLVKLAHDHPEDASILTTLTDWLIQTNRLKKAEETAQTILKILPDQAQVHLVLGRLQRLNGQLDQAISHLSDAITIDPNLVDAYIEMGKTYQDRRDLEKAIQIYQKGSQVNASDPRPYYYAGIALKECKDYPAAEAMLKQAKKYSPDDANIIRQLGMVTALNLINNLRETS